MSGAVEQVVVVTGASGGIGRATAQAFGARGAKVALLACGQLGLQGAAKEVEAAGGTALPGVPPTFRTAEPIGSAPERTYHCGQEVSKVFP